MLDYMLHGVWYIDNWFLAGVAIFYIAVTFIYARYKK